MNFRHIAILTLLVVANALCLGQQESDQNEPIIGRAGHVDITEREFLERFELTPGLYRHRKTNVEEEKQAFLTSMIAEKLLAQEALARKLDQDSVYKAAIAELTHLIARDQLYKLEIRANVTISAERIRDGIHQALKQLHVRFLFFPREEDARFVRRQLEGSARDFERFQIDSSMNAVEDTATVIWGDADTTIEQTAYGLREHQMSPVVHAGDGWYIFRLLKQEPNDFYGAMQQEVLAQRVEAKLREREEHTRALEYTSRILKGKQGYSPFPTFKKFAELLEKVYSLHAMAPRTSFTEDILRQMEDSVSGGGLRKDTLIVAGPRIWTVEEALRALYVKGLTVEGDTVSKIPQMLRDMFQEWVGQELLAQEALARGIDRSPEVQKALEPWRQQYLAAMMSNYIYRTVGVTERELFEYVKSTDTNFAVPEVQLRILRMSSLDAMSEALRDLEAGTPFQKVVERWAPDMLERKRSGVTDFFPVTERAPMGEIAWQMDVGQVYGPVRDSTGVIMLELLGKKNVGMDRDTSYAARLARAKRELVRMKQRRAKNLFLAQVAARQGYAMFQDRLAKLEVTTLPMLTFRLLGFGGRMFAAPFVEKNLEWLDIEPPEGIIVP